MATTSLNCPWWRRAHLALWLIAAGYAVFIAAQYYRGYEAARQGMRPVYTDYSHTYAAAIMLRDQLPEDLYRDDKMIASMQAAAIAMYGEALPEQHLKSIGFSPWMYPPTFMFVVAPLAYLPYLLSLIVWTLATSLPYLAAMRMTSRDAIIWPLSLSGPPVFYNLMYGQSGFLSAGLIGMGLASLQRNPLAAGVCIGLASIKPHLGILIPIALAAGGHWKAFATATATTIALVIGSALAFGVEPWLATIGSIDYYLEGFRVGGYNFNAMASVLSAVRLAGGSIESMWLFQNSFALIMAALVAWVWWRGKKRPETIGLQSAVLCLATPLAIPFVFVYDLVIVMPAIGWLVQDFRVRGVSRWEITLLVIAMGLLLITTPLARASGVQLSPLLIATMLAHALYRYARAITARTNLADEERRPGEAGSEVIANPTGGQH